MQPTIPALVNDLAPDHLRGRYNALSSGAFSLAAIVAPAIAGWLIGHALGSVYIAMLVAGCGAVVGSRSCSSGACPRAPTASRRCAPRSRSARDDPDDHADTTSPATACFQ